MHIHTATITNIMRFDRYNNLSDEAQKMVCDAYLLPGRADVKNTNRTALSDIRQLEVNWDWMMEHSTDIATRMVKMLRK